MHEIGGTAMSPPQLSRYAPILDCFKPAIPLCFGLLGGYKQFTCSSALIRGIFITLNTARAQTGANLNGFLSQRLAAHPPLRLEYRFNDIAGFAGGSIRLVSTLRVFY